MKPGLFQGIWPAKSHGLLAAAVVASVALSFLPPGRGRTAGAAPPPGESSIEGKISGEVRLSGRVRVTGDVLVLPGATLVLAPGTVVAFDNSDSSKVDPEYFHGGTELVVRGTLYAADAEFRFPGRTGGIVVAGGRADLSGCLVTGAEAGISVVDEGKVAVRTRLRVTDCRVGIVFYTARQPTWAGDGEVVLDGNGVAMVRFEGASPVPSSFRPTRSEEAALITWNDAAAGKTRPGEAPRPVPSPGALRIGDTFVDGNRTLAGDVIVDGVIRVAPEATLTIAPGSRLFFGFRDTDGDGIGEAGIFVQGTLSALGTAEKPIGFYPLGSDGRGRWDSINFMASDRGGNVLAHVEIEGAYRGLHAHFSRLKGGDIRIARCFRGVQFQESDVALSGLSVADSISAMRCRDSNVTLSGLRLRDTTSGANFLRSAVKLVAPEADRPGRYGFRFRESRVEVVDGVVRGGLVGVSVQGGTTVLTGFRAVVTGLAGFSALDGDVTMARVVSEGAMLDALSATAGKITVDGGSLSGFGRYAVKLAGPADVTLRGVARTGGVGARENPIYDGRVSPGLGIVRLE